MFALKGAKVLTMAQETIINGTILIENGKIVSVGSELIIPEKYTVIDVSGKVISPGMIDAHTHMGVHSEGLAWSSEDYNEKYNPITPQMHVIDGFYQYDIGLAESCAGGVTTVMIAPGSANPIGGQCMVVKTKAKPTVEEMIIRKDAGLKIAFGENPRRVYGNQQKAPVTRMGTAALIRETFQKCWEYLKKNRKGEGTVDFAMEAIAKVIRKEMPLRAHAHRVDDILTAIRIAEEFDVDIIIEHGTEGHLIADILAEKNIPVVAGPLFKTRGKMEINNRSWLAPGIFEKHGVKFSLISDHPVIPSRFLPVYAGMSVRFGLSEERALRALTIDPAEILGIGDRVGSIESGKDADLVIWSGNPLDVMTKPEKVIVDGEIGEVDMAAGQIIHQWKKI